MPDDHEPRPGSDVDVELPDVGALGFDRPLRRGPKPHRQSETDREMVVRHVAEGELRVARQREIVSRMQAQGFNSELAETFLLQLVEMLDAQRIHLARMKTPR